MSHALYGLNQMACLLHGEIEPEPPSQTIPDPKQLSGKIRWQGKRSEPWQDRDIDGYLPPYVVPFQPNVDKSFIELRSDRPVTFFCLLSLQRDPGDSRLVDVQFEFQGSAGSPGRYSFGRHFTRGAGHSHYTGGAINKISQHTPLFPGPEWAVRFECDYYWTIVVGGDGSIAMLSDHHPFTIAGIHSQPAQCFHFWTFSPNVRYWVYANVQQRENASPSFGLNRFSLLMWRLV